ncbi:MAG: integrase core domain-containing protein [Ignavibacteria bacterium]|nr:integrase core domain-containing protein [Ignavibacteria bacterium]
MEDSLWRYGAPDIINSDQGAQFTTEEWQKLCRDNGIESSMSHKGGSADNAYVERFWRALKFEGFYLDFPETMAELKTMLSTFIKWYNEERLHSSLKYKTPMEVLKMAETQTYGYVDNLLCNFPISPQVQQLQIQYCF